MSCQTEQLATEDGAASWETTPGPSHLSPELGDWIASSPSGEKGPIFHPPQQEGLKAPFLPPWRVEDGGSLPPSWVPFQSSPWALACGVGGRGAAGWGHKERTLTSGLPSAPGNDLLHQLGRSSLWLGRGEDQGIWVRNVGVVMGWGAGNCPGINPSAGRRHGQPSSGAFCAFTPVSLSH